MQRFFVRIGSLAEVHAAGSPVALEALREVAGDLVQPEIRTASYRQSKLFLRLLTLKLWLRM